eukprot:3173322-Rhodomonas_salina.1
MHVFLCIVSYPRYQSTPQRACSGRFSGNLPWQYQQGITGCLGFVVPSQLSQPSSSDGPTVPISSHVRCESESKFGSLQLQMCTLAGV